MTDHTNHRTAAEDTLTDAREWGRQAEEPTPEVGELTCLAYAAVHALLAIHDTLTAADRYAANEERQREEAADASGDRSFAWAEYRREYQPNPRELNAAHKAFLAGWEARSEEEAECSRCGEQYAGTAEATLEHHRACTGETPENPMGDPLDHSAERCGWKRPILGPDVSCELPRGHTGACSFDQLPSPDPLDEDDHRDRMDRDGSRWTRRTHLWCLESCACYEGTWKLDELGGRFGPLTFAPEVAPDPLNEDDHRDRLDREGVRLIRNGQRHWHRPVFTDCAADCWTSLAYWDHLFGPLTFAPDVVEPDPLDEDDHRDRIDGNGQRWGRMDGGCWHHEGKYPHDLGRCSWTLQQLQGAYGLLTFAPDTAQDAARDDLSALEGESGAVEWG